MTMEQANSDNFDHIAAAMMASPGASQVVAVRGAVVAGQADEHRGYFDLTDTPWTQASDLIELACAQQRDHVCDRIGPIERSSAGLGERVVGPGGQHGFEAFDRTGRCDRVGGAGHRGRGLVMGRRDWKRSTRVASSSAVSTASVVVPMGYTHTDEWFSHKRW